MSVLLPDIGTPRRRRRRTAPGASPAPPRQPAVGMRGDLVRCRCGHAFILQARTGPTCRRCGGGDLARLRDGADAGERPPQGPPAGLRSH